MGKATVEQLAAELRRGGRWTESTGRRVLDAWEQSGESGAAFARKLGDDAQRLFGWRKWVARTAGVSKSSTPTNAAEVVRHAFVPVTVRGATADVESAAPVVSFDRVQIEVRDLDAATASWCRPCRARRARSGRDPAAALGAHLSGDGADQPAQVVRRGLERGAQRARGGPVVGPRLSVPRPPDRRQSFLPVGDDYFCRSEPS